MATLKDVSSDTDYELFFMEEELGMTVEFTLLSVLTLEQLNYFP